MITPLLTKLYQAQPLTTAESKQLFNAIIQGQLDTAQLAAALISLKMRGETVDEIIGAVQACLTHAKPFPRPDYTFADIVGTGGDGSHSINISTTSAFVAACCGKKIAKHGNRGVSSRSGSSDLLAAFNIDLNMSSSIARQALDELNVCFLFAPNYHPGFRYAVPVRQQLKTRTIFNLLGPLINPAHPPIALIGVYSQQLVKPIIETLQQLGYEHAAVVYGSGLDEVAIHDVSYVAELENGKITYYTLHADDFGLKQYPLAALKGGDPQENHHILSKLLQGQGEPAHEAAVAANVSLLLRLFGHADLKANTQWALDVIQSGQAYQKVEKLAALSQIAMNSKNESISSMI